MFVRNRSADANPEREAHILLGYLSTAREQGLPVRSYGSPPQGYYVGTSDDHATSRHPFPSGITATSFAIPFTSNGSVVPESASPAPDASGQIVIELTGSAGQQKLRVSTSTGLASLVE
jgi:hypothetical protein